MFGVNVAKRLGKTPYAIFTSQHLILGGIHCRPWHNKCHWDVELGGHKLLVDSPYPQTCGQSNKKILTDRTGGTAEPLTTKRI